MLDKMAIEFNHVYKTYHNDKHALKNITLKIQAGEFVYLTGHSGAGKSTLFKLLSAQEQITSGYIKINDFDLSRFDIRNIHHYRKNIGLIFQDYRLLKDQTCFVNISLPLQIQNNLSSKDIFNKVNAICEKIGIDKSHLDEFPESLSGGEQQKIAVARALIHDPKYIFADEPTGNLDKENSYQLVQVLQNLCQSKVTVIMATHDEVVLKGLPSRQIELKKGEIINEVFR